MIQSINKKIKNDLVYYQLAHQNKVNVVLHYLAFLFAFLAWLLVWTHFWLAFPFVFLHYIFSWVGHYCFEQNRPASLKRPFLGFYAGFLWFFLKTGEILLRKKLLP